MEGEGWGDREKWGALPPWGPKGRDHAALRGGWQCRMNARGVGLWSPLRFLWNLGFFPGVTAASTSTISSQPHPMSLPHDHISPLCHILCLSL